VRTTAFSVLLFLLFGRGLDGVVLTYEITGPITSISDSSGLVPGVSTGETVNAKVAITSGVPGTPGYAGEPGWPRSMTYDMPTGGPVLLSGNISIALHFATNAAPLQAMVGDVPAPGAPVPVADRLQFSGFGQFSTLGPGTLPSGTMQLILTDPSGTALTSPDLPSGPIGGFPEAQLIVTNAVTGTSAAYTFVPTVTLIPEPTVGLSSAIVAVALLCRRRRVNGQAVEAKLKAGIVLPKCGGPTRPIACARLGGLKRPGSSSRTATQATHRAAPQLRSTPHQAIRSEGTLTLCRLICCSSRPS
jgi:hypothetical protein